MEKLNLYSGKIKKISISTFALLIILSLIPSSSLYFFERMWINWKVSGIIANYPEVFNTVTVTDTFLYPEEIEQQQKVYNKMIKNLERNLYEIKNTIEKSVKSTFFIKVLFNTFYNLQQNKEDNVHYFIKEINFDGKRFTIIFYEFSSKPFINIENLKNELKKLYKDVDIKIIDSKRIYGAVKFYKYQVGGNL
ncbi:hypothetical protein JYK00_07835 [Thermosipho ferrireducens]|uniref:Uncharacterized protein n=1 Tax=Thermosipho ferrireducens TaxID=2571116 RepID=A0ABX7S544_9BACT|nr:hypothetical protein [Thermosipho ferrireducens]QTA37633.1 hypothetical protein JYK00_07835 [Thermosipho ferrireducens]